MSNSDLKKNPNLKIGNIDPELFHKLCRSRKKIYKAAFSFASAHQAFINGRTRAITIDEEASAILIAAQEYAMIKNECDEAIASTTRRLTLIETGQEVAINTEEMVEAEPKEIAYPIITASAGETV